MGLDVLLRAAVFPFTGHHMEWKEKNYELIETY